MRAAKVGNEQDKSEVDWMCWGSCPLSYYHCCISFRTLPSLPASAQTLKAHVSVILPSLFGALVTARQSTSLHLAITAQQHIPASRHHCTTAHPCISPSLYNSTSRHHCTSALHCITASLHDSTSLHHGITAQQHVTASRHHCTTACHCITASLHDSTSLHHGITARQHVTASLHHCRTAHHCITARQHVTASLHHYMTAHHCITASLLDSRKRRRRMTCPLPVTSAGSPGAKPRTQWSRGANTTFVKSVHLSEWRTLPQSIQAKSSVATHTLGASAASVKSMRARMGHS
eukprot:1161455-Pelagomonas_calceolata.AAC.2